MARDVAADVASMKEGLLARVIAAEYPIDVPWGFKGVMEGVFGHGVAPTIGALEGPGE